MDTFSPEGFGQVVSVRRREFIFALFLDFLDIELLHVISAKTEREGIIGLSRAEVTILVIRHRRWHFSLTYFWDHLKQF